MASVIAAVVDPYAEALMSLGQAQNLTDQFGEELKGILALINESQELEAFLANPIMAAEAKKTVLRQAFQDQVHPLLFNFLMLLVDRQRINFLGDVARKYLALLRELKQIALAEVTSAVELTDEQKNAVVERVKGMTGAQGVELEATVDTSILGGVIIKVGSQVVDASIRGQLRRIGVNLSRSAV
jgi:F-type H+-transporting ATPase subunit delta